MILTQSPSGKAIRLWELNAGAESIGAAAPYFIDMRFVQAGKLIVTLSAPAAAGESLTVVVSDLDSGTVLGTLVIDATNGFRNVPITIPLDPIVDADEPTETYAFVLTATYVAGGGPSMVGVHYAVLFSGRNAIPQVAV
jgi:hypothetical protein